MNRNNYSMIIVSKPSTDYTAGELAGSVPAHLIACKLNKKVFWFCKMNPIYGIMDSDIDIFQEMINKIINKEKGVEIGKSYKGVRLNQYGYFYDGYIKQIAWRFKLEQIFYGNYFNEHREKEKEYLKYFSFRDVYLHWKPKEYHQDHFWFLISDIKKIVNPIGKKERKTGADIFPGFKYQNRPLTISHFHRSVLFCPVVSKKCNQTKFVKAEDEIDTFLKQLFLKKSKDKTLRERAIQLLFAITLWDKYDNWTPILEENLPSKKRPDIIFKEGTKNIVVVEIKRGDENPVDQLDGYIKELKKLKKKKYHDKNFRGLIICGEITKEIENDARKKRYPIDMIQYEVSLKFEKEKSNKKK